jgi:hypothetical protein
MRYFHPHTWKFGGCAVCGYSFSRDGANYAHYYCWNSISTDDKIDCISACNLWLENSEKCDRVEEDIKEPK